MEYYDKDFWMGRFSSHRGIDFDIVGLGAQLQAGSQTLDVRGGGGLDSGATEVIIAELARLDTVMNYTAVGGSTDASAMSRAKREGYVRSAAGHRVLAALLITYAYAAPALNYGGEGTSLPRYVRYAMRDTLTLPWIQPYHAATAWLKRGMYADINRWLKLGGETGEGGIELMRTFRDVMQPLVDTLTRIQFGSRVSLRGVNDTTLRTATIVRCGGAWIDGAAFLNVGSKHPSAIMMPELDTYRPAAALVPDLAFDNKEVFALAALAVGSGSHQDGALNDDHLSPLGWRDVEAHVERYVEAEVLGELLPSAEGESEEDIFIRRLVRQAAYAAVRTREARSASLPHLYRPFYEQRVADNEAKRAADLEERRARPRKRPRKVTTEEE